MVLLEVDVKNNHSCHTGNVCVFEIDNLVIYAGGWRRCGGWTKLSPFPQIAIGPSEVMQITKQKDHICKFINMNWPDFGLPCVEDGFWLSLVQEIEANSIKNISCQCMGGHGRTGTQLAILGYLLKDKGCISHASTVFSLVMYIRSIYCDCAVETVEQQEYIAKVLCIPIGDTLQFR